MGSLVISKKFGPLPWSNAGQRFRAFGRVSCSHKKPQPTAGRGLEYCAEAVLLDGFDHVFDDLLGITEDHHGLVQVEQFVIQPGVAAGH